MKKLLRILMFTFILICATLPKVQSKEILDLETSNTISSSLASNFTLTTSESRILSQEKLDSIVPRSSAIQQNQDLRYVNNVYTFDIKAMQNMDSVSVAKTDSLLNYFKMITNLTTIDRNKAKIQEDTTKKIIFPFTLLFLGINILWLILSSIIKEWNIGRSISTILMVVSFVFILSLIFKYPNLILIF